MHRTTPARIAPPAPGGPPIEGLLRRKEMTMTTTMIELREVDRDEMACVEGGFVGGGTNQLLPWPIPPGRAGHPPIVDP
jgi:hypothetical protein